MFDNKDGGGLSWAPSAVLSAAYLVCGLCMFPVARKFSLIISTLEAPLLLPTQLFIWIGARGWFAFTLLFSALLLARCIHFRADGLNRGIVTALWVAFGGTVLGAVCMAAVTWQPVCDFTSNIGKP